MSEDNFFTLQPLNNKDKDLYQFALFMKANNINNLKEIANGNEYFEKAFRKVEEYMSDKDKKAYEEIFGAFNISSDLQVD